MAGASEVRLDLTSRKGVTIARLVGAIDETFGGELQKLTAPTGSVIIDLDGVTGITSFGVRAWVSALEAMKATYYCFVRCRPSMIAQFNMIGHFGRRGEVVSLYAPYLCSSCGTDVDVLIDLRKQRSDVLRLAETPAACPRCAANADFDDVAESYFSYVLDAAAPNIPADVEEVLSVPFRVEKEVTDDLTALWFVGAMDSPPHLKRLLEGLEGRVLVVMSEVYVLNEQGRETFRRIAGMEGVQASLARVPGDVAVALLGMRDVLGSIDVVSVNLSVRCAACGADSVVELDEPSFPKTGGASPVAPCLRCGELLSIPSRWARLAELPWGPLPPVLKAYLGTRRSLAEASPTAVGRASDPRASAKSLASGASRYEIVRPLGRGGMGTVYLARAVRAGGFERLVAVKRMHPHLADDANCVAMFLDEARLAARIHHPNVVPTLDVEENADGVVLVMDYVEGLSLHEILERLLPFGKRPPMPVSLRILTDALAGLHCAHQLRDEDGGPLNLVHRDASTANLLVGVDGVTRVTDFGIAVAKQRLVQTTDPGRVKGTPGYMAPEQSEGREVDLRADVFSLGVVTCELLYRPPYSRGFGSLPALLVRQELATALSAAPVPNDAMPRATLTACLRAMSVNPGERFPTALAFLEALEAGAAADGFTAAPIRVVGALVQSIRETQSSR
jgi:hypothetical protein